jgi:hypothetical protein
LLALGLRDESSVTLGSGVEGNTVWLDAMTTRFAEDVLAAVL